MPDLGSGGRDDDEEASGGRSSGGRDDGGSGGDDASGGAEEQGTGGDESGSGGNGTGGDDPGGASGGTAGACDEIMCSTMHAETSTCDEGVCSWVCDEGYDSCNDASVNDGCETDLTRVENCGSCGHECSVYGVSSDRCNSALCDPVCLAEYADCSEDTGEGADDGCETHLNGLKTCGMTCGSFSQCGSNQVCNTGQCVEAQGVGVMNIPFSAKDQRQRYAFKFPTTSDLTGSVFIMRLHSHGAPIGLDVYASDVDSNPSEWHFVDLTGVQGWTDISIPIEATDQFDPSKVKQITWEFSTLEAPSYSNQVFSLDRVWSSRMSVEDSFDTNLGGLIGSNYVYVQGSSLYWSSQKQ